MEHPTNIHTPYFSFDLVKVKANYHEFISLLPGVSVFFAMKCNALPEILEALFEEGSGFEIASIGELKQLLSIGVAPNKIIFSNPVKPKSAIEFSYKQGVRRFAFDSEQELVKLSEVAPGSDVYMRLAVSESGSRFSMSEKFGVSSAQATQLAKKANMLGLNLSGIAFHVGSQAENIGQWRAAITEASAVVAELADQGTRLDFLNIGGGFPESYLDGSTPLLADIAKEVNAAIAALPYEIELYVEPGRRLVANSATLTTQVIARLERAGENWLFLDAGAYNSVFEAMVFQGNMRFNIDAPEGRSSQATSFVLTGPTCDSLDTISYDAQLPNDIQEGDKLVISNVGAYSLCFASTFNGFEIPSVVFV